MTFAEKILKLRKEKGIPQNKIAKELGVSRQTIYKWESGVCMPELEKIKALAQIYSVSYDILLNDDVSLNEDSASILQKEKTSKKYIFITLGAVLTAIIVLAVAMIIYHNNNDDTSIDTDTSLKQVHTLEHETIIEEVITEPTCEEKGMAIEKCTICDYEDIVSIKPLGHTENGGICIVCGWGIIKGSEGIEYAICDDKYASVKSIGDCVDKDVIITNYYMGYPVKVIETYAFYCSEIESVTMPSTIEKIESYAFKKSKNLTVVNLNEGLKEIGAEAFSYCGKNESLIIPDSTEVIRKKAFYGTTIKSITLGLRLNKIESGAFYNCGLYERITFKNLTGWKIRYFRTGLVYDLNLKLGDDFKSMFTNTGSLETELFKD